MNWPELPPGYEWDHTTSPARILGPNNYEKYSGGGPNQAARITWNHHREQEVNRAQIVQVRVAGPLDDDTLRCWVTLSIDGGPPFERHVDVSRTDPSLLVGSSATWGGSGVPTHVMVAIVEAVGSSQKLP